jgi:hypothetical protein
MSPRSAERLSRVLRCFIGLVLLATGAGKLLDVTGFAEVLRSYQALPAGFVAPLALAVPLAESMLGVWLISGRHLVPASLASAAMHIVYAGWAAGGLARGLKLENCGCFGVFFARPLTWRTVIEDFVMVALSLALCRVGVSLRRSA